MGLRGPIITACSLNVNGGGWRKKSMMGVSTKSYADFVHFMIDWLLYVCFTQSLFTLLSFPCNQNLSINTDLHAANGKRVKALDIFAYALAFFKEQALKVRNHCCCFTYRMSFLTSVIGQYHYDT